MLIMIFFLYGKSYQHVFGQGDKELGQYSLPNAQGAFTRSKTENFDLIEWFNIIAGLSINNHWTASLEML